MTVCARHLNARKSLKYMSVHRSIPITKNTLRDQTNIFQTINWNMFKKIWFYCFMQILINYSAICTANPIVGISHEAKKGEYPFVVSLSRSRNIVDIENHFCGGTLISKRLVLTAEHCVRAWDKEDVMVIVKTLNFDSGQIYEIKSWITYEEWALSQLSPSDIQSKSSNYREIMGARNIEDDSRKIIISQNDIAIITLSTIVENVEPVKITALHDYELIGKDAVTVGWGSVSESSDTPPDTLLEVNLKVLSVPEIRKNFYQLFKTYGFVDPHYFYTLADPPAVLGCGDSGGPLMLRSSKKLIGVNKGSCSVKNLQTNKYSMSRHVKLLDKYRKFIKDMEKISKY